MDYLEDVNAMKTRCGKLFSAFDKSNTNNTNSESDQEDGKRINEILEICGEVSESRLKMARLLDEHHFKSWNRGDPSFPIDDKKEVRRTLNDILNWTAASEARARGLEMSRSVRASTEGSGKLDVYRASRVFSRILGPLGPGILSDHV